MSTPECCATHKSQEAARNKLARRSCCPLAQASSQPTCHSNENAKQSMLGKQVIAKTCPGCKCISELQIVAIPGFTLSEKTYRLSDMAPVVEMPITRPTEQWAESHPELGHPGIVITLQTCSFRC